MKEPTVRIAVIPSEQWRRKLVQRPEVHAQVVSYSLSLTVHEAASQFHYSLVWIQCHQPTRLGYSCVLSHHKETHPTVLSDNFKVNDYFNIKFTWFFVLVWNSASHPKGRIRIEGEYRVLKRILGPEREEVTGRCRRLQNEELHNLYVWPDMPIITAAKQEECNGWTCSIHKNEDKCV
jgi:hypothetical protein